MERVDASAFDSNHELARCQSAQLSAKTFRSLRLRSCLVGPRRIAIWFAKDGSPEQVVEVRPSLEASEKSVEES